MSDIYREFQLVRATGISADYFNDIICVAEPQYFDNPTHFVDGGEPVMRERISKNAKALITYTELIMATIEIHNRTAQEPWRIDELVVDFNRDRVKRLDEIAIKIQAIGQQEPGSIDLVELKKLMHAAATLIYGEDEEEKLRKRFRL